MTSCEIGVLQTIRSKGSTKRLRTVALPPSSERSHGPFWQRARQYFNCILVTAVIGSAVDLLLEKEKDMRERIRELDAYFVKAVEGVNAFELANRYYSHLEWEQKPEKETKLLFRDRSGWPLYITSGGHGGGHSWPIATILAMLKTVGDKSLGSGKHRDCFDWGSPRAQGPLGYM
jgi:hypothetical protein